MAARSGLERLGSVCGRVSGRGMPKAESSRIVLRVGGCFAGWADEKDDGRDHGMIEESVAVE